MGWVREENLSLGHLATDAAGWEIAHLPSEGEHVNLKR